MRISTVLAHMLELLYDAACSAGGRLTTLGATRGSDEEERTMAEDEAQAAEAMGEQGEEQTPHFVERPERLRPRRSASRSSSRSGPSGWAASRELGRLLHHRAGSSHTGVARRRRRGGRVRRPGASGECIHRSGGIATKLSRWRASSSSSPAGQRARHLRPGATALRPLSFYRPPRSSIAPADHLPDQKQPSTANSRQPVPPTNRDQVDQQDATENLPKNFPFDLDELPETAHEEGAAATSSARSERDRDGADPIRTARTGRPSGGRGSRGAAGEEE